jgi:hypothetical protein
VSDTRTIARIADANPVPDHVVQTPEERADAERLLRELVATPVQGSRKHFHRWDPLLRHRGTLAMFASACVTIAVVVLALSVGRQRPVAGASGIAPSPAAAFPVLRRPRRPTDALTTETRRAILLGQLHMFANRSRLVVKTPVLALWLVPARGELCLVEVHGRIDGPNWESTGCTDIATAERRGLTALTDTSFTAILPRGTSPIEVTLSNGSSRRLLANADGGLAAQLDRRVRSITYTGPTGEAIRVPPGFPPPPPPRSCQANAPCGPRQPLPRALVRGFRIFQGLSAYQARVIWNRAGLDISVVPQARQTCIESVDQDAGPGGGSGDCVTNRMALAGEMSPITGGRNGVTVIGLVPDGNRSVRLTLTDGSSETVRVRENVYVATAARGFRTVTVKDSAGAVRTYRIPDG